MVEQRKMSKDNPIRIAWEKYKVTDEYKNSFKWFYFFQKTTNAQRFTMVPLGVNFTKTFYSILSKL